MFNSYEMIIAMLLIAIIIALMGKRNGVFRV